MATRTFTYVSLIPQICEACGSRREMLRCSRCHIAFYRNRPRPECPCELPSLTSPPHKCHCVLCLIRSAKWTANKHRHKRACTAIKIAHDGIAAEDDSLRTTLSDNFFLQLCASSEKYSRLSGFCPGKHLRTTMLLLQSPIISLVKPGSLVRASHTGLKYHVRSSRSASIPKSSATSSAPDCVKIQRLGY